MSLVNTTTWIRYCICDQSRSAPWPLAETWLTTREQSAMTNWRSPVRQRQWLWGRWLSKQIISQAVDGTQLNRIEIVTRDSKGLGIRPQVTIAGCDSQASLSISHSATGVLVAFTRDERRSIGVDLACNVPSDGRFRSLWFTAREQQFIAASPAEHATLLWGLKEAVFKASGPQGRGWNPAQIEIHPEAHDCFHATICGQQLGQLAVHRQEVVNGLAIVVSLPRQITSRVLAPASESVAHSRKPRPVRSVLVPTKR